MADPALSRSEIAQASLQTQLPSAPMKIHVCPTGVSLMTLPSFTELLREHYKYYSGLLLVPL